MDNTPSATTGFRFQMRSQESYAHAQQPPVNWVSCEGQTSFPSLSLSFPNGIAVIQLLMTSSRLDDAEGPRTRCAMNGEGIGVGMNEHGRSSTTYMTSLRVESVDDPRSEK